MTTEPDAGAGSADLADRLLAGDRGAVAPALNLVDDQRPAARVRACALLDTLQRHADALRARRVGITGAPGAGKSTLLDALVRSLRPRGRSVGILAVDPSSRRTGGALLGDRFRVRSGAGDDGVFLRSMAARNRLGGLSDATASSIEILSAVFDYVFVETVGVGQSESEITHLVDTLVFVAQPDAGDTLQFMKAGILEVPDVFLVNKSDVGAAAARTARELASGLGLAAARGDDWKPPVLLASARDGGGIDELVETLERHHRHAETTGALAERRLEGRVHCVEQALLARYGSFGLERVGAREALEVRVREACLESVASLVDELAVEIEDALAKPGVRPPERVG
jgi:LAO/AO transport system kinase